MKFYSPKFNVATAVVGYLMCRGQKLCFSARGFKHTAALLTERPLGHKTGHRFWGEIRAALMPGGIFHATIFALQHTSIFPWPADVLASQQRGSSTGLSPSVFRWLADARREGFSHLLFYGQGYKDRLVLGAQLVDAHNHQCNHATNQESGDTGERGICQPPQDGTCRTCRVVNQKFHVVHKTIGGMPPKFIHTHKDQVTTNPQHGHNADLAQDRHHDRHTLD